MAAIFRVLLPITTALWLLVTGSDYNDLQVIIKTEMGDIVVVLYKDKAPVTVENFLIYVDSGLFNGSSFYRSVRHDNQPADSVKIEVIQGGRQQMRDRSGGFPSIEHETTLETGILHTDGTLSMARVGPGTARAEFFVCIGDQPELDYSGGRNRDGQGFAAFGRVIQGMEVVRYIHSLPVRGQTIVDPVTIIEMKRIAPIRMRIIRR